MLKTIRIQVKLLLITCSFCTVFLYYTNQIEAYQLYIQNIIVSNSSANNSFKTENKIIKEKQKTKKYDEEENENTNINVEENTNINEIEDEDIEIQKMLQLLEEHTEIVTKTKMNSDYVPGMATILYGDNLESLGITTVAEALSIVPGIEYSMDQMGFKQIIVRKIGKTFSSGNIKFLLESNSTNTSFNGYSESILLIPISLVERIEIIRGPGSAVHGEFAYIGVINVVIKKDKTKLISYLGKFNSYQLGSLISKKFLNNQLKLSLSLNMSNSAGANVQAGPDLMHSLNMENLSNSPGPSNEINYSRIGVFSLNYKNISLFLNYINKGSGDYFGINSVLPKAEKRIYNIMHFFVGSLDYKVQLLKDLSANFKLGIRYQQDLFDKPVYFPDNFLSIYPNGIIISNFHAERNYNSSIDFILNWFENHNLLIGLSFSSSKIIDSWQEANVNVKNAIPEPLDTFKRYTGSDSFLSQHKNRLLFGFTLQDEFNALNWLTITGGLRYDHYNDVGNNFSPRIAAVLLPFKSHIFKIQYSEDFRPPTFMEMHLNNPMLKGNPDIKPERIKSLELGYIFKSHYTILRLTAFTMMLKQLVSIHYENFYDMPNYYNLNDDININGFEIAIEQSISYILKISTNFSYLKPNDAKAELKTYDTASILGNAILEYYLSSISNISLKYLYVGKRKRMKGDTRDDLDGYQTFDIAINIKDFVFPDIVFRGGLKNFFDYDVRYPSVTDYDLENNMIPTYIEDLPRPGLLWWIKLEYLFH